MTRPFSRFHWKPSEGESTSVVRANAIGVVGEWDAAALPDGVESESDSESASSGALSSNDESSRPLISPALRVSRVSKRFGKTLALDDLSFTARRGEITALLGHNGAGKTTCLSMLLGSGTPDRGDVWVDGVDVARDLQKARASLGVCPQFDVLWPTLTVREHLELFAGFRRVNRGKDESASGGGDPETTLYGADANFVQREIREKLVAVGLANDADRPAGTLSGGQRRKLSLAIAFMGDPRVVLLDEPTAGMDPVSRRRAWEVIRGLIGKKNEDGKTTSRTSVLLTTHFMDEADALSDRVVVVHAGKLACAGSPLFVKTRFGGGYVLKIRTRRSVDGDAVEVSKIAEVVSSAVAGATLANIETPLHGSCEKTVTFILPTRAIAGFPKALRALEGEIGQAMGVLECSVGCATLEDAFLNVANEMDGIEPESLTAHDLDFDFDGDFGRDSKDSTNAQFCASSSRRTEKRAGMRLFASHARATFWKRAIHCRRELVSTIVGTVVAPLLFVVAGLLASSAARKNAGDPLPAPMLDWKFLGNTPIGIASSAGRDAFVTSSALSPPASPYDVVRYAGDVVETLGYDSRRRLVPMAGVDRVWDCEAEAPVLDACVHECARCGPQETTLGDRPLESILQENLLRTISAPTTVNVLETETGTGTETGTETGTGTGNERYGGFLFETFSTLDGILLSNAKPRATCRVGVEPTLATCASLFVEPGGLNANGPRPRNGIRAFRYTLATSSTAYHALPAAMALTHDAIFRTTHSHERRRREGTDDASDRDTASDDAHALISVNHPLPSTFVEKQQKAVLGRILVSLCAIIGVAALSASSAVPFLVRETARGAKHLQMTAGLRRDAYWCGTFLWDITAQTPTLAFLFLSFAAFGNAAVGKEYAPSEYIALSAALALFVFAATPLSYLVASQFQSPAAAVAASLGAFVFFGVAQLIAGVTLGGLADTGTTSGGAATAWRACRVAFLWLPHYCVGRVVFDVSGGFGTVAEWARDAGGAVTGTTGNDDATITVPSTTTDALVALSVTGVLYAALALLVDRGEERRSDCGTRARRVWNALRAMCVSATAAKKKENQSPCPCDDAECAVAEVEAKDSSEAEAKDSPVALRVQNLRKRYPSTEKLRAREYAVDDVTFSVRGGESFALLGVNGAGKTTTFEMLTGAIAPTEGDAEVLVSFAGGSRAAAAAGGSRVVVRSAARANAESERDARFASLRADSDRFRRLVGYCPQRDALLDAMSAYEHLIFYGILRGVSVERAEETARELVARVALPRATALRPSREYSGGNKRKLAVAIALTGDVTTVLLDEPSTGMDPRSRRRLWSALRAVSANRRVAIVLTSHSMEEAEALCGRVGLVKDGVLGRIGDASSWRSALGTGHTLEIRTRGSNRETSGSLENRKARIARFVFETFSSSGTPSAAAKEEGKAKAKETSGGSSISAVPEIVEDTRTRVITFRVPQRVSTAFIFEEMEAHRERLGVEDYQLGATTLEETFLRFAQEREAE
jgi:ABC-type multidrug transport system ATPase subunit